MAAEGSYQIIGLGINPLFEPLSKVFQYKHYQPKRGDTPDIHPWLLDRDQMHPWRSMRNSRRQTKTTGI